MATALVRVEFQNFRDPAYAQVDQDYMNDAYEISAGEAAIQEILDRLNPLYAKGKPADEGHPLP